MSIAKRQFKNKMLIRGSGSEIRSFIYIEDFIKAFNLILNRGKHLNIYNIGTTEKIKIKDLAYIISKIFKKKISLRKTKIHRGSTVIRCPNIKKIQKLGFQPKTKLKTGLINTIKWYC